MKNSTTAEQLYDVLIVHCETRIVDTIAGDNMRLAEGHHNAERRQETVSPRLNDHYYCGIFLAGKYPKGAKVPEDAETF